MVISKQFVFLRLPSPQTDPAQANILIDDEGSARLSDFGLITLSEVEGNAFQVTQGPDGGSTRWMSPELIMGSTKRSKESDVYAFGMTVVEVAFLVHLIRTFDPRLLLRYTQVYRRSRGSTVTMHKLSLRCVLVLNLSARVCWVHRWNPPVYRMKFGISLDSAGMLNRLDDRLYSR